MSTEQYGIRFYTIANVVRNGSSLNEQVFYNLVEPYQLSLYQIRTKLYICMVIS